MVNHLHDLLEITIMALALGMDAFSLAIGIGLNGVNRRRAWQLASWIGLFHVVMALLGLTLGMFIQGMLGQMAHWFGALLLIGLGLHMLLSTLYGEKQSTSIGVTYPGMIVFAAGVSIDALSVGFSLGLRSTAFGVAAALAFGVAGAFMCLLGLLIGKRATKLAGRYGEVFGAAILIGFGVHFILG